MSQILRFLFLVLVPALVAVGLSAQEKLRKEPEPFLVPIPERLERATEKDENGVLQWAKFEAPECVNCKGTKKMTCRHCERMDDGACPDCPECHNTREATCRVCAGEGKMPDILERAPCPTCAGAALTRCSMCGGMGVMSIAGDGDNKSKCVSCKGKGGYACGTCDGKRWVPTPKMKPSFAEGKLADYKKLADALEKVSAALGSFESTGDGRKDMKAMAKVLAPGLKQFPAFAGAQKHFEAEKKGESNGSVFTKYADTVREHTAFVKQQLDYYIKHQRRVLELVIARAEANAEAGDGKK